MKIQLFLVAALEERKIKK